MTKLFYCLLVFLIAHGVGAEEKESCYLGLSFHGFEKKERKYNLKRCKAAAWKGGEYSHAFNNLKFAIGENGTQKDAIFLHEYKKKQQGSFFTFKFCDLKMNDMNSDLIKKGKPVNFEEIATFNKKELRVLKRQTHYEIKHNPGVSSSDYLNGDVDFFYPSYINTYLLRQEREKGFVFFSQYDKDKFEFIKLEESRIFKKFGKKVNLKGYISFNYKNVEYVLSHAREELLFEVEGKLVKSKLRHPCLHKMITLENRKKFTLSS